MMRVRRIIMVVAALLVLYGVCGVYCHPEGSAMAGGGEELFIPQVDSPSSDSTNYWAERRSTLQNANAKPAVESRAVQRRPVVAKSFDQPLPGGKLSATTKLVRQVLPWGAGLLATVGLTMAAFGVWMQRRPDAGLLTRSMPIADTAEFGQDDRVSSRSVLALQLAHTDSPEPRHPFVDADFKEENEEARPLRRAA